jgi:hypothetical protein
MTQVLREAFAAAADSYDRACRKLVPCFDEFLGNSLSENWTLPKDRNLSLRRSECDATAI